MIWKVWHRLCIGQLVITNYSIFTFSDIFLFSQAATHILLKHTTLASRKTFFKNIKQYLNFFTIKKDISPITFYPLPSLSAVSRYLNIPVANNLHNIEHKQQITTSPSLKYDCPANDNQLIILLHDVISIGHTDYWSYFCLFLFLR